jgi:hypothetical protein
MTKVAAKQNIPKKSHHSRALAAAVKKLKLTPPKNRTDLANYLAAFLNLKIPDRAICEDHCSPMDYLWHSYSADFKQPSPQNADAIVWASRAGGKTLLAAVATLLDSLFKPNCHTRILGGSAEQSMRMFEYIQQFIAGNFESLLAARPSRQRCSFVNGSTVELLTQSPTSVRGQHIQKLRCDELELFAPDVFNAAKFTTQTKHGIVAAMEILSTMHKPYGLMQKTIDDAKKFHTPIFNWCVWEAIEKCTDRNCSRCPLDIYCQQKAKRADGYFAIDDCITMMKRSSRAGFETEMLCKRPNLENVVFDQFDPDIHIKPLAYNSALPLYRSLDFGYVNPFVCLWIQTDDAGNTFVIDEYIQTRKTIEHHAKEMLDRTPAPQSAVIATFCDPAGAAVNDVTGTSPVTHLRSLGIKTKYRKSAIIQGIELIRRSLMDGQSKSSLFISPKCKKLIEALRCYHYPDTPDAANPELPEKDGIYDHPIDALRYFFVNSNRKKTTTRRY